MESGTAIFLATLFGPIIAVIITLWHQERSKRRDMEQRLFVTLMAHRKSFPPPVEWVNALNLIDVVFFDRRKVLTAWRDLYDYFHVKPMDLRQLNHKSVALLTEIAKELGYKNLQQIDIDKFYSPIAHGEQARTAEALQTELLRVLQATERLSVVARGGSPS